MKLNLKNFGCLSILAGLMAGCSTLDHAFAPDIAPTTASKPAPYSAPAITGKRKFGNPYTILGKTYYPLSTSEGYRRKGVASWYGKDFHAKKTANGETYNMYAMTAAHPTLPIPTYVRVTNLENGLSTIVRVNDRGPFLRGRIIDLSYAAARTLNMAEKGTAPVLLEALPTDGSMLNVRSRYAEMENNVTNAPIKRYAAMPVARPTPKKFVEKPVKANASGSFTRRIAEKYGKNPTADESNLSSAEEVKIGRHQYYVQTGAFSSRENAAREQIRITEYFPSVKLMSFVRGAKTLHRVRIGPVSTVDEADEILSKIAQEGWSNARIVVD